jgi:hypothetical protein
MPSQLPDVGIAINPADEIISEDDRTEISCQGIGIRPRDQ